MRSIGAATEAWAHIEEFQDLARELFEPLPSKIAAAKEAFCDQVDIHRTRLSPLKHQNDRQLAQQEFSRSSRMIFRQLDEPCLMKSLAQTEPFLSERQLQPQILLGRVACAKGKRLQSPATLMYSKEGMLGSVRS